MSQAWRRTEKDWRANPQEDLEAAWSAWQKIYGPDDPRDFSAAELKAWQFFRIGFLCGRRDGFAAQVPVKTASAGLRELVKLAAACLAFTLFLAFGEPVQAGGDSRVEVGLSTAPVGLGKLVEHPNNFAFDSQFFDGSSQHFVFGTESGGLDDTVDFTGSVVGPHVDEKREDSHRRAGVERHAGPVGHLTEKLCKFGGMLLTDLSVKYPIHAAGILSLLLAGLASLISFSRTSDWSSFPCLVWDQNSGVRTGSPMEGLVGGRRAWGRAVRFLFSVFRARQVTMCGRRGVSCLAMAIAALALLSASAAHAAHRHLESWYADALAECLPGARTEVRMRNGTRCDVLTGTHAIEVDFGAKWGEGIGQSLNYAVQTGRAPAVAAIVETARDERGLAILRETIAGAKVSIAVIVLRPFGRSGLTLEFPAGIVGRPSIDFRHTVEAVDFIKPQSQQK